MLIICKIKRCDGSVVEVDKNSYHFKPNADGDHVADVTNPSHIAKLLSISEAYCLPGGEAPEPAALDVTDPPPADGEGDDSDAPEDEDANGEGEVFDEPNASMYAMMARDELAKLVERRTGQVPHHRTGKDTLIATLQSFNA